MNTPQQSASQVTGAGALTSANFDAEDTALVEKAVAGDAEAFEKLFLKYRQRVFAVAWRLLRDEDSALDVVQDAFVRAYQQLENLRGEARFYPWVRRIAVNLSIDRLRHIRRGVEVSLDEHRVGEGDEARDEPAAVVVTRSGSESPSHKAEVSEFSEALSMALLKLSENHRTVFMLHAAEGMSYKEIAETLDCNIGTVMSRLFYARKRLQELLAPHIQEES
ncbi:MAG TPA: sigma-70 family RNA polymerase sigma factor [Planctomycetota bacterium]|nr:sigma-70 family RNA polymerase sigma factor [Planctomycetota bacterium]